MEYKDFVIEENKNKCDDCLFNKYTYLVIYINDTIWYGSDTIEECEEYIKTQISL